VDNVCHYRLHSGSSPHSHIWPLIWENGRYKLFLAITWACHISLCRRTWKSSSAGVLTFLVDNTRAVREYLDGISREQWDRVRRDAVVYRLFLLGETASALPDILRDRYPDVA
jgi:hypothetical protein